MARTWDMDLVNVSREQLLGVVEKAIWELGYEVTTSDGQSGAIWFKTGMSWKTWTGQRMTASVTSGANGAHLSIAAEKHGFQLVQWGEKGNIADKVLAKVGTLTPQQPS